MFGIFAAIISDIDIVNVIMICHPNKCVKHREYILVSDVDQCGISSTLGIP
jgi:hypothetical protein